MLIDLIFDKHSKRKLRFSKLALSQIFQFFIDVGGHVGLQNPLKIGKNSNQKLCQKKMPKITRPRPLEIIRQPPVRGNLEPFPPSDSLPY